MNAFIRLLYALLIAAAVVTFVGVSLFSIYQPPKPPDYPDYPVQQSSPTYEADYKKQQDEYEKRWETHRNQEKAYQRKITLTVLPVAIVIIVIGLWLLRRSEIIGEGLALGGIATSVYGIITASIADDRLLRPLAVALFLAATLVVTHQRFLADAPKKK